MIGIELQQAEIEEEGFWKKGKKNLRKGGEERECQARPMYTNVLT